MGVDSKAVIRKGTTIKQLTEFLETEYENVKVRSTNQDYYFNISFKDEKDGRNLSVFYGDLGKSDYGLEGVLLSLGLWGNSIEIMKNICNKFGGYLDENDCDDKDFYLINEGEFNKGEDLTEYDLFSQRVIKEFGYEYLEKALKLFEDFKTLK